MPRISIWPRQTDRPKAKETGNYLVVVNLARSHHFRRNNPNSYEHSQEVTRLWPFFIDYIDCSPTDPAMSSNKAIVSSFVEGAPPGEVSWELKLSAWADDSYVLCWNPC